MLIVADVNTIWRSRPFEALAQLQPTLGLEPMDRLLAIKRHRIPWGTRLSKRKQLTMLTVVLPVRWASRLADTALHHLWSVVATSCRSLGEQPSALVVTLPQYAPLARTAGNAIPVFYYCSDDYRGYEGWDSDAMLKNEREIVQGARHSFFVSEALRNRAVKEYGVDVAATSVSMNATDETFLNRVTGRQIDELFVQYPQLKRPLVGLVGGVNERLDYSLLLQVASVPDIGTLLLVGPIGKTRPPELRALLDHPRVLAVGAQPHEQLPVWQQALDVALIPYRKSDFNYFCSPMRLFDHLAAGRPVVASDACPQILHFQEHVRIAYDTCSFVRAVVDSLGSPVTCAEQTRCAADHTWTARANLLKRKLDVCLSLAQRP